MPRIETLSSGVGQIETRATASSLVDTRGMESLSNSLGEISDTFKKMEIDEQQIQAARVLSEARQQWMFDFDKRKTEAETNGTYQGFTQSFQKDYRAWMPNAVKGIRNKDVAAKLELSLMDLETSFLGDAISYESSQRGKILKENYAQALALPKVQIDAARTPEEVDDAYFQAQGVLDFLPDGELKKEGFADINAVKLGKQAEMVVLRVDDYDKVLNEIDQNEFVSGDQKKALGFNLNQARDAGYSKIISNTNEELAFLEKKAENGALEGDYTSPLLSEINKLPDDIPEKKEVVDRILSIERLNKNIKLMADMNDAEYSQLEESMANSNNPNDYENVYNLAKARIKYKENLSKDFAGTVMAQTPMARKAYDNYSKTLADNSDVGVKNQKQAFDVYASYLETKADKLGIPRTNINYITQNEASALVDDIKGSLKQTNGNIQVSSIIDNMAVSQGGRFYNTLKQMTDLDKELLPLGALPRVTGGDKRSQVIKNNIIEALSIKLSTPEAFNIKSADGKKVEVLPVTTEKAIAFEDNNLSFDNNSRKAAYELLYMNEYRKTGKAPSVEDLEETVYGDIRVQLYEDRKILYPVQYQSSISVIMKNAERMIEKNKSTLNLLENALEIDEDYVNDRPLDYITFKSSSGADGVMAIWNGTDGQPVKNKKGEAVIYSWKQLETMSK